MELTEEQKKFVAEMEEEFSDRFTETDDAYWEEHTSPLPDPPIIEPWYNKQRRRFDYSSRGRDNSFNGRNGDHFQSGRGRYERHWDQRRDGRSRDRYDNRGGSSDQFGRDRDRSRSHRDQFERDRDNYRGSGDQFGRDRYNRRSHGDQFQRDRDNRGEHGNYRHSQGSQSYNR